MGEKWGGSGGTGETQGGGGETRGGGVRGGNKVGGAGFLIRIRTTVQYWLASAAASRLDS